MSGLVGLRSNLIRDLSSSCIRSGGYSSINGTPNVANESVANDDYVIWFYNPLLSTRRLRLLNEEEEKSVGSGVILFCGSCILQFRRARFYQKPSYMYFTIECPYIKWPSKNLSVVRMPVTFDVIKTIDDFDSSHLYVVL